MTGQLLLVEGAMRNLPHGAHSQLGMRDRVQLTRYAIRRGLITP